MSSLKPDLCIYHGNCDDGFGAAWVVRKKFGDVHFFAGVYGNPPPPVDGKHVLMVDFSYKRPVLDEMFRTAGSLLILDHHKTAQADLEGIRAPFGPGWDRHMRNVGQDDMENCQQPYALFDMERSGAQLAWDFLFPDQEQPKFIKLIGDRDLWRFQYGDDTRKFSAALRTYPMTFEKWDHLAQWPDHLIEEGHGILRAHNANIQKFMADAYIGDVGGHTVPIVNVPYHYASDTAHELLKKYPDAPFAGCWFKRADGMIQWSLRSEDSRLDVSEVAKQLGGGGHRNAAGFQVSGEKLP